MRPVSRFSLQMDALFTAETRSSPNVTMKKAVPGIRGLGIHRFLEDMHPTGSPPGAECEPYGAASAELMELSRSARAKRNS